MIDKILLFPYYLTLLARKKHCYGKGAKSEIPSVCVGNVTVGGTGKTPHTEMILRFLSENGEWKTKNVSVLSRGYKRTSRGFQQVREDSPASFAGDEPLQIKRKFPDVTVAVDKDRVEGCMLLSHPEILSSDKKYRKCEDKDFPPSDIVILDDAFQYRKLDADLKIVLVNYNRPVDSDRLIPLGKLRDLPSRLSEADVVIVTKCPSEMDEDQREEWRERLGIGEGRHLFFTHMVDAEPQPVFEEGDRRYVYSKKAVMFSGIADDRLFLYQLTKNYKVERRLSFSDHHKFSRADISKLVRAAISLPMAVIATTEKDAQRIKDSSNIPEILKSRMFYYPMYAEFLTYEEQEQFKKILFSLHK